MKPVLAILAAPLATLVAVPMTTLVLGVFNADGLFIQSGTFVQRMEFGFGFGIVATLFAYPVMLTAGLAAISIARRFGWEQSRHFAALGALVGSLPFTAMSLVVLLEAGIGPDGFSWSGLMAAVSNDVRTGLTWITYGAAAGSGSALFYWNLANRQRSGARTVIDQTVNAR